MELTIKYRTKIGRGWIIINVENFLDNATIKDFRKIVKIIDTSETPEARKRLKDYIMGYLYTTDILFNANKPMLVGWFDDVCKIRKRYTRFLCLL